MLSNLDNLFIRACKSENPASRITSLIGRKYSKYSTLQDEVQLLSNFMTNLGLGIKQSDLIKLLAPQYGTSFSELEYYNNVKMKLITHIRFTDVTTLQGFIYPAKFRNSN